GFDDVAFFARLVVGLVAVELAFVRLLLQSRLALALGLGSVLDGYLLRPLRRSLGSGGGALHGRPSPRPPRRLLGFLRLALGRHHHSWPSAIFSTTHGPRATRDRRQAMCGSMYTASDGTLCASGHAARPRRGASFGRCVLLRARSQRRNLGK